MTEQEINNLIEIQVKNAAQPLYDKITELETVLSALARIATEHSESYPADYQELSNFLNRKG